MRVHALIELVEMSETGLDAESFLPPKDAALRSYERCRSLYENGLYSKRDYELGKTQYEASLKELEEAQAASGAPTHIRDMAS